MDGWTDGWVELLLGRIGGRSYALTACGATFMVLIPNTPAVKESHMERYGHLLNRMLRLSFTVDILENPKILLAASVTTISHSRSVHSLETSLR